MKTLIGIAICAVLAGCGVETAGTAATAAAIKKQEVEQAQNTLQQAKDKIGDAMSQTQTRAAEGGEK